MDSSFHRHASNAALNRRANRIEVLVRCRTDDGNEYTVKCVNVDREAGDDYTKYMDRIEQTAKDCLREVANTIWGGGGYYCSEIDAVSIKSDKVSRIWADVGDVYY